MGLFYIKNETDLVELSRLENAAVVGLDLETTGLEPHRDRVRLIQLHNGEDTLVVDCFAVNPMEHLRPLLINPKVTKVLHNAKFDVKFLMRCYDLEMKGLFDTMLASRLLALGQPMRHNLAEVAFRWLDESVDKSLQVSDWGGDLTVDQIHYAAADAELVYRLHEVMDAEIRKYKMHRISQLEFRTVVPMAAMELKGIFVDPDMLDVVNKQLKVQAAELEEKVLEHIGGEGSLPGMNTLNLAAPEQVRQALVSKGLDLKDTGEQSLRPYAKKYPYVEDLLKWRHINRILNNTLIPFKDHILPETGRIHAHYQQTASPSGRMACSEPSVHQVPREAQVRSCFKPQTGYLYIIADYSQVELRVAAGLAKDPLMLEIYAEGGDIHRRTAAITMNKHPDHVTSSERQAAKAINFGLVFAMGPRGLQASARHSYGVEFSLEQATAFRDRYYTNYRGIRDWHRFMDKDSQQRGYVRTGAGRVRSYKGQEIRINEMLNVPVQGTAAEGLKSAMCIFWDRVKEQGLDAGVVAVIHDEIIVEVHQQQAEQTKELLERSMIDGISWLVPNVPFEVEAHVGLSWAEK